MKKTIKLMNKFILLGVFTFLSMSVFGQANATPTKHKLRKMTAAERTGYTPSTTTETTTKVKTETTTPSKVAKQQTKTTTKPANQVAKALMNELTNVPVNERASYIKKRLETTTDEQEKAWLNRALLKYKQQ